jgi:protein gp37
MSKTKIEWADRVWNPVTGCTKISEGCKNCYAERMSKRLAGRCGYPKDYPFKVTMHPERLKELDGLKKPSKIFVCSMGDLFHYFVPFDFIGSVFEEMICHAQHTFMVLTKRPARMKDFIDWYFGEDEIIPSNIWLGVSAENQAAADERIPILLQTRAAVRFVSCEPLLGKISLNELHYQDVVSIDALRGLYGFPIPHEPTGAKLDWVIVGGETSPRARPCHPDWVRGLRDQCQAAQVPFFFKSWGEWIPAYQILQKMTTRTSMKFHHWNDGAEATRVGKKASGRLLDGREWDETPEVRE